ncbi:MAG: hypothetical protein QOK28_101 [Actinomycetota bacterium]|jgi:hypothetical protein
MKFRRSPRVFAVLVALCLVSTVGARAADADDDEPTASRLHCDQNNPTCAEAVGVPGYDDQYVGHDEPALLFYSDKPGSGNSSQYSLRIPTEPTTMPNQNGTGGTYNFQRSVTFWFGMALCDNQSAPEFTHDACQPDTDLNIFENAYPNAPDYVGRHPGGALLEVQFYSPGFAPAPDAYACDPVKWCAALNIFSVNYDYNRSVNNNEDCLDRVGVEPANYAYITRDGKPANSVDPFNITYDVDPSKVLMLGPGDDVGVDIHDTAAGVFVGLKDRTTGQAGSMTASRANGFQHVVYSPRASTCTEKPYAFHPMYSTSSERTRVPWGAHSSNISFANEIGHFEYCDRTPGGGGGCTNGGDERLDSDDTYCFKPSESTLVRIGGCLDTDTDWDGPPYKRVWPGTDPDPATDVALHGGPVSFSSPISAGRNYERVAFENALAFDERTEAGGPCHLLTGEGCVDPPPGAAFYPVFSTRDDAGACSWQMGGRMLPDTKNTFGDAAAEYGPVTALLYPGPLIEQPPGDHPTWDYTVFRRVLDSNPCRAARSPA